MVITEYDGENMPPKGVKHYHTSAEEGEVDPETRRLSCIQSKMEDGMTREEAKEACDKQFAEEVPASAEDKTEPEEIYTSLDHCMEFRTFGGETTDVARSRCLAMFKNPDIKAAFDNYTEAHDPFILARLVVDWEFENLPINKSRSCSMKWRA